MSFDQTARDTNGPERVFSPFESFDGSVRQEVMEALMKEPITPLPDAAPDVMNKPGVMSNVVAVAEPTSEQKAQIAKMLNAFGLEGSLTDSDTRYSPAMALNRQYSEEAIRRADALLRV